jgi:hypothetical protein
MPSVLPLAFTSAAVGVKRPVLFAQFWNSGYVWAAAMNAEGVLSTTESANRYLLPHCVQTVRHEAGKVVCTCSSGTVLTLPPLFANRLRHGDEIVAAGAVPEVFVHTSGVRGADLYYAGMGYAAQPRPDRRSEMFIRIEVEAPQLAISAIHVPCHAVRDYFFVAARDKPWSSQASLYKLLHVPQTAGWGELRLAYRIRRLELRKANAPKSQLAAIERAYNLLADPQYRPIYDELLTHPDTPVPFPYSGFGSLLVQGELAKEAGVFFASRILAFLPKLRQRTILCPLRRFEFFDGYALLRDHNHKLEARIDQQLVPLRWDPTWNQWRHLLSADIEVTADFIRTGHYRKKNGEWRLMDWETALPSRTRVICPDDLAHSVQNAQRVYVRFGCHFDQIDALRRRIEHVPMERDELRRLSWDQGLPGDFDVAQISWRPDYDPDYYKQLSKRARTMYLFRNEYIFDLPGGVAVETPQAGHATYLFAKPERLRQWVKKYAATTRQDILDNRNNIAKDLGFLGRIVHGRNTMEWIRDIDIRIGGQMGHDT